MFSIRNNKKAKASKKKRRDNEHLQCWLRLNELLKNIELDTVFLKRCINCVFDMFGDKGVLSALASNANKDELQSMYTKMKELKLESENQKRQYEENEVNEQKNNEMSVKQKPDAVINTQSLFEILPGELIGNICDYLSKGNVNLFQNTSRQIAIECLKYKNKISIIICDTEKLLNAKHSLENYCDYPMTTNRYPLNHKLCHIFNNNQIILNSFSDNYYNSEYLVIRNQSDFLSKTVNQINKNNRKFVTVRKSKVIIFNNNSFKKFDDKINIENMSFIILEYFNIFTMASNVAAFILFKSQITPTQIMKYIENQYIYLDEMDNTWRINLMNVLKPNSNKLNKPFIFSQQKKPIYRMFDPITSNRFSKSISLTVQLNAEYDPSIAMTIQNTKQFDRYGLGNTAKYNLRIWMHEKCPYPSNITAYKLSDYIKIQFEYKRVFTPTELVKYMLLWLKSKQHHNDLTTLCLNGNEITHGLSFVVSDSFIRNNYGTQTIQYLKMNEIFYNNSNYGTQTFNIYVIQNRQVRQDVTLYENKKRLIIRFVSASKTWIAGSTRIDDIDKIKYCGFPLIAWIDSNDTLEQIIYRYVDVKAIKEIGGVYRVIIDEKIQTITKFKTKMKYYKPWNEFLKNNADDFLIVKLKTTYKDWFDVPQWIHNELLSIK